MKKLSAIILLTVLTCLSGNTFAAINTFTSSDGFGTPNDVLGLDHKYIYSWRIESEHAPNEAIISASLKFVNIRNWKDEGHDLRVYLLDKPIGTDNNPDTKWRSYLSGFGDGEIWRHKGHGNDQYSPDAFVGTPTLYDDTYLLFHYDENTIFSWDSDNGTLYEDDNGDMNFPASPDDSEAATVTYYFDANDLKTLNEFWKNDGKLGIGLDPDCHYYNGGIYLDVEFGVLSGGSLSTPEPATLMLMGVGIIGMTALGRKKLNSRP